jgi:hypothetical protein
MLFSPNRRPKPGPKGPSAELIHAVVEMKQRNHRWGCPRIAEQIALAFNLPIDKDVVRRILAHHYWPGRDAAGPSWLTFLGHMKDSLWSMDLFRCESATLRTHWVWLPKTPSELKMQWFRAFVRSWWYHDELSFGCPFRFGHLQFSNPWRPAGGDPRAASSTRGFPEECTAAFAPPALRPAFVGLAVTMVARLAPESTHRSPRYSDRLAP